MELPGLSSCSSPRWWICSPSCTWQSSVFHFTCSCPYQFCHPLWGQDALCIYLLFFAAYTVSPFTCYRHKVSHYLICPVTLTFLYRLLQSLPRAPLGAVFLFFLTEKEAMQSANIIISTKLLFTDMRTMLCCKVLICRWLSICPPSPPTFDHHNWTETAANPAD